MDTLPGGSVCASESDVSDVGEGEGECESQEDSDSEYNSATEVDTTETETDGEGCVPSKCNQYVLFVCVTCYSKKTSYSSDNNMSTYMYIYLCCRLSMKGTNLRTEPKHIVFLSQLLLLFKFCHVCKADNPMVEAGGIGTQAAIKTICGNPACRKEQTWYSQPLIPGTQMPAGNFLLCLSILLVGGSATKIFQMFSHMGLGCISLNTFFKCQRVSEDVSISSIYLIIHQLHIFVILFPASCTHACSY